MPRFRKIPVEIEAVRCGDVLDGYGHGHVEGLPAWAREAYESGVIAALTWNDLTIKTLEGDHLAQRTDWIIRGVNGELYPCKPDIFAKTYEPVTD